MLLSSSEKYDGLKSLEGRGVLLFKSGVGYGGQLIHDGDHRYVVKVLDGRIVIPFGVTDVSRIDADPERKNPSPCITLNS
jgi:hypothetical protein